MVTNQQHAIKSFKRELKRKRIRRACRALGYSSEVWRLYKKEVAERVLRTETESKRQAEERKVQSL